MRTADGERTSFFNLARVGEEGYCSVHQGNYVPTADGYFSVNAWYEAGVDVIDWTDPSSPQELAFYDETSDNWSAYWYEGASLPGDTLTLYARTAWRTRPPARASRYSARASMWPRTTSRT